MVNAVPSNVFHITVGTSPVRKAKLSLESELRLLKAALLYADRVKFCSLTSSGLLALLSLGNLSGEQMLQWFGQYSNNPEIAEKIERYHYLKENRRRRREVIEYAEIRSNLRKMQHNARLHLEKAAVQAGIEHLQTAYDSGLVEIDVFDGSSTDDITQQFFNSIGESVLNGETYPLFDDTTGNLVNLGIEAGILTPSTTTINRSKQVGLSTDLFKRLPLFDDASIDEVLDIRRELGKPLIRFRGAIVAFSRDIQNASWSEEFPREAEHVFRERVEPTILDLEEACKSNNFLAKLVPKFSEKGIVASLR